MYKVARPMLRFLTTYWTLQHGRGRRMAALRALAPTEVIMSSIAVTERSLTGRKVSPGIATPAFITTTLMGGITRNQARRQQETQMAGGTRPRFQSRQAEGIAFLYGFATQGEIQEQHF